MDNMLGTQPGEFSHDVYFPLLLRIDQIMIVWIMPFTLANHDSYCPQYSEVWPFPILAPSTDPDAISTWRGNDEAGSDRFWGGSSRGVDTKADFCFYGRWLQKGLRMRKLYDLSFSPCCASNHRIQTSGGIRRFLFISNCHSFAGNIICASCSPFCTLQS